MGIHRDLHDMYQAGFATYVTTTSTAQTITCIKWGEIFEVTTTGSADPLTLARPTKPGLMCAVVLSVDAGNLALTVTGGYNFDGDTAITFGDAKDMVVLLSYQTGSTYQWMAIAHEGTSAVLEEGIFDTVTTTDLTLNSISVDTADMTPGTGISTGTGTVCEHRITKFGALIKTEILIDLTGLNSSAAADIIGVNSAANCHIGQITAAKNGTVIAGRMSCLETPAGGEPDIDLYSATVATGTEDTAITALEEDALLNAAADWTAATAPKGLTALPPADEYLYLVGSGGGDGGTYTAGQLLIELWGT